MNTNIVTVCAGVAFKNDKIMITRRKKDDPYPGMWEFPGGKLEKDESPEQCIVREIKEELCVDACVLSFLKEIVYDYPDKRVKLLFYKIELKNFNFTLNAHDKAVWEKIEKLDKYNFLKADIDLINFLQKNFKFFHGIKPLINFLIFDLP